MTHSPSPARRPRWLPLIVFAAACGAVGLFALRPEWFPASAAIKQRLRGQATVAGRVRQFGPAARARLRPHFERAGVAYPPRRVVLVGLKQEKRLEVYASGDAAGPLRFIRAYPILAASGRLGPKLREGDLQVPEGAYRIASLNPNSAYHLALRVDYPNADDRARARAEGRKNLGGDIMIHGSNGSVGCLAMGDPVSEDLFVLAAETRPSNLSVLLCPVDLRRAPAPPAPKDAPWVAARYADLRARLRGLPTPPMP